MGAHIPRGQGEHEPGEDATQMGCGPAGVRVTSVSNCPAFLPHRHGRHPAQPQAVHPQGWEAGDGCGGRTHGLQRPGVGDEGKEGGPDYCAEGDYRQDPGGAGKAARPGRGAPREGEEGEKLITHVQRHK